MNLTHFFMLPLFLLLTFLAAANLGSCRRANYGRFIENAGPHRGASKAERNVSASSGLKSKFTFTSSGKKRTFLTLASPGCSTLSAPSDEVDARRSCAHFTAEVNHKLP